MKTVCFLIICLIGVPAQAKTIVLNAGECTQIHAQRVCSQGFRQNHTPKFKRTTRENRTSYGNITCSCLYGFGTPVNQGDPMKGWWLIQHNAETGTRVELKNFGGNQSSREKLECETALSSPSCLVGTTIVERKKTWKTK